MPQHVTIVDYDPSWPQRFREERDRLCGALGEAALAIWHIGSTSVPGLAAKPVVDVLARDVRGALGDRGHGHGGGSRGFEGSSPSCRTGVPGCRAGHAASS